MFRRTKVSQMPRHRLYIFKYITVFFLGASATLLSTQAFDISTSLSNAVQYIAQIVITSDGSNLGTTGIVLNGDGSASFDGNVGIGTDTPSQKLEISGGNLEFSTAGWIGTIANQVTLATNGNVGIGATTPSTKLHIENPSANTEVRIQSNTDGQQKLSFWNDTESFYINSDGENNYEVKLRTLGWPMLFGTNDTERMKIATNGNIGIGTSNPSYKLDVSGTGRFTKTLYVSSGYIGPYGLNFGLLSDDDRLISARDSTNSLYTYGDGAITVNSSTQDVTLSALPSKILLGTTAAGIVTGVTSGTVYNYISGFVTSDPLYGLWTESAGDLYPTTLADNVGIGDSSPSYKLDVNGTGRFQNSLFVSERLGIKSNAPDYSLHIRDTSAEAAIFLQGATMSSLRFGSTGSSRTDYREIKRGGDVGANLAIHNTIQTGAVMTFTTGGNVGIGTSNPGANLEVNNGGKILFDATSGNVYMSIKNNPSYNGFVLGIINDRGTINNLDGGMSLGNAGEISITGGRVGIGTFSPSTKLDVDGGVTANAYFYSSDRRLKTDITTITDPLQKILSLNGYAFTWKANGRKDIGVIAQEVEEIFPEIVHTDNDGYKSVEYGNLVAPLIEAIRSLNQKIEAQNQRIQVLESMIK